MRRLAFLVWLCVFGAARAGEASPLDDGVRQLFTDLDLLRAPRFSPRAHVALAVASNDEDQSLARTVARLFAARLESNGLSSFVTLEPADASASDVEDRAKRLGAEWLIWLKVEAHATQVTLKGELRTIDRGLWGPVTPHGLEATAERTLTVEKPVLTEPPKVVAATGLRFQRGRLRVASIESAVLALERCTSDDGTTLVFALTPKSLIAFLVGAKSWERAATLDLTSLPRAKEPVRDPFGRLVCAPGTNGELLLGSSALEQGRLIRIRTTSGGIVLAEMRPLPGIPLGAISEKRMLFGRPDGGRNWYTNRLYIEENGTTTSVTLPLAFLDIVADARLAEGSRVIGVSTDFRAVALSDDLARVTPLAISGAGISAVALPEPALILTSSSARASDRVRLLSLSELQPRNVSDAEIEGRISATAVGVVSGEAALWVAAWRDDLHRTEIYSLSLSTQRGDSR